MDGTKTTTNWIIAGLVALVVIIGGGWLVARERSGTVTGSAATTTDTTLGAASTSENTSDTSSASTDSTVPSAKNPVVSAAGETVTVSDQPAGDKVVVADVSLGKPSWVVIRDTKGWALGAAWFNESQKGAEVALLRNTNPGQTYEAVVYVDNGDKKFELHGEDMLVTSSQGAPVSSTFTAK